MPTNLQAVITVDMLNGVLCWSGGVLPMLSLRWVDAGAVVVYGGFLSNSSNQASYLPRYEWQ